MNGGHDRTGAALHRFITAAFGLMFAGLAVAIVFVADRSFGPMLVAVALGILGVDAIVCACRDKPSLLSRIGPLP